MANANAAYQRARQQGNPGWMPENEYAVFQQEVLEVFKQSNIPLHGKALEIGCGAGNMTHWLAQLGFTATGIDSTETAIEWAIELNQNAGHAATFLVDDVCTLNNLSKASQAPFDLVLDGHCLHWISGAKRLQALSSIKHILKPDGHLVICSQCGEPDAKQIPLNWQFDVISRELRNAQGGMAAYYGTQESICKEAQQAGFNIVHQQLITEANTTMGMLYLVVTPAP